MEAMGWTMDDFALASELQAAEQSQALCDNNIDAMIYTVGHPSGSIQEATTACDSVLVEVSGDDHRQAGRRQPVLPHRHDPRRHVSRQRRGHARPSASARPS
jgi:TRAP-type uncharacterized transport system substrate-binding protein